MNYDLAMRALEGLAREHVEVVRDGDEIRISGGAAAFRELARLCLLLGQDDTASGESLTLDPGVHATGESARVTLQRSGKPS